MEPKGPGRNLAEDHPTELVSTASFTPPAAPPVRFKRPVQPRRRISPEAGRTLEKLGHAIEYLADELVHEGDLQSSGDPRLQAIQVLMELNRQVYFECPIVASRGERLRRFLGQLTGGLLGGRAEGDMTRGRGFQPELLDASDTAREDGGY